MASLDSATCELKGQIILSAPAAHIQYAVGEQRQGNLRTDSHLEKGSMQDTAQPLVLSSYGTASV